MSSILLTNDDGYQSPLFQEFIKAVSSKPWCSEALVTPPAGENSWISQAFSRFGEVKVEDVEVAGHKAKAVHGTPADCVAIGTDHLWGKKADYVFSGINFGENSGRAFFFCSGTIGATIAGMNYGIRSISFSLFVPETVFSCWHHRKGLEEYQSEFQQAAETSAEIGAMLIDHPIWDHCDLISVNIPWGATMKSKRLVTDVQTTYLENLFAQQENGNYTHRFRSLQTEDSDRLPGDHDTIRSSTVSITPVRVNFNADLPDAVRESLEN